MFGLEKLLSPKMVKNMVKKFAMPMLENFKQSFLKKTRAIDYESNEVSSGILIYVNNQSKWVGSLIVLDDKGKITRVIERYDEDQIIELLESNDLNFSIDSNLVANIISEANGSDTDTGK